MNEAQRSERRLERIVMCSAQAGLKANDCLQTPHWIWSTLGAIDLDPCAAADTTIGAVNYAIERGENGLALPWFGFVYCNPPFSQKEAWAQQMIEHGRGILILPERGSAPWFGPLANAAGSYWVMGRKINFIGGPSSNNLGSVLFPFGAEARARLLSSGLPGHLADVTAYRPRQGAHNAPLQPTASRSEAEAGGSAASDGWTAP